VDRRFISKVSGVALLLAVGFGCRSQGSRAPVIGEAYVGPAVLNVRSDFPLDSKPVATVKHGDKLEIIGRRRKFLRVRTGGGAEGWTDERLLLAASDMDELRALSARAAKMPSQGVATTFRELNVHTQPSSGSPSFLKLKEGEKFDVVAEIVAARKDMPRQPLIPKQDKKKAAPKKPKKEPKIPPPPLPKPPGPPPNWLDLSKTELEDDGASEEPPKPIPTDYWSLVRTASGQSGWVLTRFVSMAIPDEVAQYAEGHRIVSYHALGYTEDDGQKKPIWLWTTVRGRQPFDFDSFRVFVWSIKRHRYETAYIDRNVEGYWPVLLTQVDYALNRGAAAKYPGFSVCVEKDDGKKYRREYALLGSVVRFAGEHPCELPPPVWTPKTTPGAPVAPPADTPPVQSAESLSQRVKAKLKAWFQKKPKPPSQ
jgi:hypothetical protein